MDGADWLALLQVTCVGVQDLLFAVFVGLVACDLLRQGVEPAAVTMATAPAASATRADALSVTAGRSAPRPFRARASAVVTAAALTVVLFLSLWLEAAVMSGAPLAQAWASVGIVLTQTHFGAAWIVNMAGALAMLTAAVARAWTARRPPRLPASPRRLTPPLLLGIVPGLILYSAGKAATGHAADSGDFTWREAADTAHLLTTALWAGAVMISAVVLSPCLRAPHADTDRRARSAWCRVTYARRLSRLAATALLVVLVSGGWNAVDNMHLGMQDAGASMTALVSGTYGPLLLAKLTLVAGAIAMGGWNRQMNLPAPLAVTVTASLSLSAAAGVSAALPTGDIDPAHAMLRRFERLLIAEAGVMVAIIAVAAALGHASPTSMKMTSEVSKARSASTLLSSAGATYPYAERRGLTIRLARA